MRHVLMTPIIVVCLLFLAGRCWATAMAAGPARITLCRDGTSSTWAGALGCWTHGGAR